MGQLALAVVGTVVGSMFGMPQLGFMLGSLAGSFLFAPSGTHTEGPRLQDLQTTGATYGSPIGFGIGTARLGGNIIWSPGLEEHEEEESQGGKGGGGGSTVTTYTYSASFAVAFCEGPKDKVLRIWGDGKCIYDTSGTEDVIQIDGLRWTFYPGDETQLPSPVIEAVEGVGQVPAHRGLCYIVFENMPLADFGNRIPSMTAEISQAATRTMPLIQTQDLGDHMPPDATTSDIPAFGDVDVDRRRIYLAQPRNFQLTRPSIIVLNSDTMLVENTVDLMQYMPTGTINAGNFGIIGGRAELMALIGRYSDGSPGNKDFVLVLDKDTYIVKSFWPEVPQASNAWKDNSCGFINLGAIGQFVFMPQAISSGTFWFFDAIGRYSYKWTGWTDVFGKTGGCVTKQADWGRAEAEVMSAHVYVDGLYIDVGVFPQSQVVGDDFIPLPPYGRDTLPPPRKWLFPPSVFGYASTTDCSPYYDEWDGNYTIILRGNLPSGSSGPAKIVKFHPDSGIISIKDMNVTTPGSQYGFGGSWYKQRVSGFAYIPGGVGSQDTAFHRVDFQTAQAENVPLPPGYQVTTDGAVNFTGGGRAVAWAILLPATGDTRNRFCKLFLERWAADGEVPVAPFVQDMAARVGLSPSDVNVTDIDDTVFGYYVVRNTSAKQAIAPLASACQFDAVESDYTMKFFHRGKAPSVTLTQSDLQKLNDEGDVMEETRAQEMELPARVVIRYPDQDHAYGIGTQSSTRPKVPSRTMQSDGYNTVETPVIMNATRAKRLAETTLYTAWQERSGYKFNPDPKYIYLDPTDTLDMTLNDGADYRQRILKMVVGADLNVSFETVGEDGATYSSDAEADGGKIPQFEIPQVYGSSLVLMDTPYLRDIDVALLPTLYAKVSGFGNTKWRGATVFKEAAVDTYALQFTETDQSTQGQCLDALPPTSDPWALDRVTRIRVNVTFGIERIASITYDQLMNWGNAAAVSAPNGQWEIIQFQTVTVIDETTIELSNLLRGRRGTDPFTDGHKAGDFIAFLRLNEVNPVEFATAEIGSPRRWKAVSSGQYLERTTAITFTPKGNVLRPYAPVHVAMNHSGTNTNITWVRRTRYGGELLDGVGTVPVNETSEKYEVDIIRENGTVARTIATTSPSAVYTDAQQSADAVGAYFSVIIYQMSETIGRGFPSRPVQSTTPVRVNQLTAIAILPEPALNFAVNQVTSIVMSGGGPVNTQVNEVAAITLTDGGPRNFAVNEVAVIVIKGA